jgi:SOS response associated peptidase (SRAP)
MLQVQRVGDRRSEAILAPNFSLENGATGRKRKMARVGRDHRDSGLSRGWHRAASESSDDRPPMPQKIPAPQARNPCTNGERRSPFHAEPRQNNIAPTQGVPRSSGKIRNWLHEIGVPGCTEIPQVLILRTRPTSGRGLGNRRLPYCFEVNEGELFAFAGIWDCWMSASADAVENCSILTTTPNAVTAPVLL